MNTENNNPTKAKFCTKCGHKLVENAMFCVECGKPIPTNNSSLKNESSQKSTPNTSNPESPHPKKRDRKKVLIPIIIGASFLTALFIFLFLTFTHIICINHDWQAPNCVEPAQCWHCDKYKDDVLGNHDWNEATCTTPKTCIHCKAEDGEPLGHDWQESTCTEPKTCLNCGETNGEVSEHTEGEWTVTKEATFEKEGEKKLSCSVCGEILDIQSVSKKVPAVDGDSFNFTDEELIDWLNDIASFSVGYTDMSDSDEGNTLYPIYYESEIGGLFLNHGDNGKDGLVKCIGIIHDDHSTALAMGAFIGEKIDSEFSANDALAPVLLGDTYTKADMTLVDVDDAIILTPSEYLAELLS